MTALLIAAAALVSWSDVHPAMHTLFDREQIGRDAFPAFIDRTEFETERRLQEGAADHLVFYVLQSRSFTAADTIIPALSAKAYHDTGAIPDAVHQRIAAFAGHRHTAPRGKLLARQLPEKGKTDYLESNYRRAMTFLYDKEFASRTRVGQERRDYVSRLYAGRGHSTDTSPNASFAASIEIEAMAAREPGARIRRVLIVGPGLDLAPRENLREDLPPQSIQPYALADALLNSGLAIEAELDIDCADINPAAVAFIAAFPLHPHLTLPQSDRHFGSHIGLVEGHGTVVETNNLEVHVRPGLARRIRAERWNILTRKPPEALYDLVVATNVLLYFNRAELLLAVNNIHKLLKPGGYFLHNDTRREMEEFTAPIGFSTVNARMVRLGARGATDLYDAAVLHRKLK